MTDKPSRNEEEYFAKLEADRLKASRVSAADAAAAQARRQHFMKCPKCGADLITEGIQGVQLDRCPECKGIWFDAGELEQLNARQESGGLGSVFRALMHGVRGRATPANTEPDRE